MKIIGLARCGTDMVLKYLPSGEAIGEVSLAFKLTRKDKQTGEYMTTWVKAGMFGKRAESLAQYITKGSQHVFYLKDLVIDEFVGKDGANKVSLKASIEDVELAGNKSESKPERNDHERNDQGPLRSETEDRQAASQRAMAAQAPSGFDDEMDGQIPF